MQWEIEQRQSEVHPFDVARQHREVVLAIFAYQEPVFSGTIHVLNPVTQKPFGIMFYCVEADAGQRKLIGDEIAPELQIASHIGMAEVIVGT